MREITHLVTPPVMPASAVDAKAANARSAPPMVSEVFMAELLGGLRRCLGSARVAVQKSDDDE